MDACTGLLRPPIARTAPTTIDAARRLMRSSGRPRDSFLIRSLVAVLECGDRHRHQWGRDASRVGGADRRPWARQARGSAS